MSFKIERIPAPLWARPLIPLMAIVLTFVLTATLILLANANPLDAYYYFLIDPLSSRVSAIEVLVKATPLLLTGAAVTFAFVGGYWNIGVEGQLYAGATAATAIGIHMQNVSAWIAIPLMLIGGFVAGMLWALVPALMKVKLAIDEVVTTLLLNSVALFMVSALLNGPWRNPISQWPQSPDIAATAIFPKLIPRSRLHLGFILALVIIVILWFVLTKTAFGLKMRAVGLSPHAAQFAGINVQQTMLISALVSGGIGGIAGVSEIAGIHYHLIDAISPGYGYTGIIIATLGTLNAWGVALAALFIGLIDTGAQTVSRALGVPTYLGDVIQAALLLVTLGMLLLQRYRITRTRSES
ncbi:MAG: ABC transporter permease [Anaerolineae bacterium]|nr:ABC transporter permease [Anaerolineae bacterium]MCB0180507.1 ABC transporter permease [Anaerolineae bacterium]MCB9102201.1 ABC transporter permease [Anaerolineales bacterium]MCB9104931.1 ABC transporter permease [Anaerolineales bacterium]